MDCRQRLASERASAYHNRHRKTLTIGRGDSGSTQIGYFSLLDLASDIHKFALTYDFSCNLSFQDSDAKLRIWIWKSESTIIFCVLDPGSCPYTATSVLRVLESHNTPPTYPPVAQLEERETVIGYRGLFTVQWYPYIHLEAVCSIQTWRTLFCCRSRRWWAFSKLYRTVSKPWTLEDWSSLPIRNTRTW